MHADPSTGHRKTCGVINIDLAVLGQSPAKARMRVDFPAPLGPIISRCSPDLRHRSRLVTIARLFPMLQLNCCRTSKWDAVLLLPFDRLSLLVLQLDAYEGMVLIASLWGIHSAIVLWSALISAVSTDGSSSSCIARDAWWHALSKTGNGAVERRVAG